MNPLEIEIAVSALKATNEFRIIRRLNLDQDSRFSRKAIAKPQIGICIDTETTGLNHTQDKIIELGMVAFEYDPLTGEIIRLTRRYSGFEDPGAPLSSETTAITGITDEMVRGQSFDDGQVRQMVDHASIVIAHNAGFDRPFVESRFPFFINLPWACSMSQIDWKAEQISTRVLEYLLYKFGWFIDAHRALNDAEGLLGVLLDTLPESRTPVFKSLLETFGQTTARISAVGAPFDKKDLLKERGYRWYDGSQGGVKSWWTTVSGDKEQEEFAWLTAEVYPGGRTDGVEISRITALDRFSARER